MSNPDLHRSILASAGFAEGNGEPLPFDSPFNPFYVPTVFGAAGVLLVFFATVYYYRADIRKLSFSFELVVSVVSLPFFGFLFGAALPFLISTVVWWYRGPSNPAL